MTGPEIIFKSVGQCPCSTWNLEPCPGRVHGLPRTRKEIWALDSKSGMTWSEYQERLQAAAGLRPYVGDT